MKTKTKLSPEEKKERANNRQLLNSFAFGSKQAEKEIFRRFCRKVYDGFGKTRTFVGNRFYYEKFCEFVKKTHVLKIVKNACVQKFWNWQAKAVERYNAREGYPFSHDRDKPANLRKFFVENLRDDFLEKNVDCGRLRTVESEYFKIPIRGRDGIWLAHPVYGHSDYNKHCLCKNTAENWAICEKWLNGARRLRAKAGINDF